jgi:two-component system cell cycle response regulator CpdR
LHTGAPGQRPIFYPGIGIGPPMMDRMDRCNLRWSPENFRCHSSRRTRDRKMKAKKILIVDNDVLILGAMQEVLRSCNYEVSPCDRAEQALDRLRQEFFDILITDLNMPEMDGFELIRRAKIIQPEIKAILVTGFPITESRRKANEEKLSGFLLKPFNWNDLDPKQV